MMLTEKQSLVLRLLLSTDRTRAEKYVTRMLRKKQRREIIVEYEGLPMSLTELAERTGIPAKTIWSRYRLGDRGEHLWRPVDEVKSRARRCRA